MPKTEIPVYVKLTKEQIENWRRVMPILLGCSGAAMSDEDVQKLHDAYQKRINEDFQAEPYDKTRS